MVLNALYSLQVPWCSMVAILDGNSELGSQEQSLLFDLFKTIDKLSHKLNFFFEKTYFPL